MAVGRVTIRFYGDLADLAEGADRGGEVTVPVELPRSVKDAVESCGVPHTEVDLVLVDGDAVAWDRRLHAGQRVSAYPPFTRLDVPSPVRPDPLPATRFVCDVHLGRLAERLRLLGFSCDYPTGVDDAGLAALSVSTPAWLLTRDRGLLMRRMVTHGYLVRADDPLLQTVEVVRRFRAADELAPLTRCARCNGLLAPADVDEVAEGLPRGTRAQQDEFRRCGRCGQVYWEGSHLPALRDFVDHVRAAARTGGTG